MSNSHNVALQVGRLRKGSFSRTLAKAMMALAPSELKLSIAEIGDLPFYNEDLETEDPPAAWKAFREKIAASDAVLFVTPE